ncbi:MAG: protease inhibitor I42 family protein [Dehalococcoidia bacterium]
MRHIRIELAVAVLSIIALLVLACSDSGTESTPEPEGVTEAESQQIALDYLLQSPTFLFDGMEDSVQLVETETLRCPYCWTFVYDFECRHAGYGDRTGQVLLQVITPHTARITVQEGEVTGAVMDERWNMMTQKEIFTEESSREMAEEFVRNSPTFVFDGMPESLKLVETLYPDIENAWQFVFNFDSRHAGYGDRTGRMLAQVITRHEAIVTVEEGAVTNAVLDQKWDMKEQRLLGNNQEPEVRQISISCEDFQAGNHIERNVTLAVGESIGVELCSNPTTGFRWGQAQISDPAVIRVLDRHSQGPEATDEAIVGAPGKIMMDVHAVKAGTCSLSMEYSRDWEGGEKGAWTFILNVTAR